MLTLGVFHLRFAIDEGQTMQPGLVLRRYP